MLGKEKIFFPGATLLGLKERTNNADEGDPNRSKIQGVIQAYNENIEKNPIEGRLDPSVFYAVYAEYESDEHGEYTYVYGQEVQPGLTLPSHTIFYLPQGSYLKFTTRQGKIPEIIIEAWQEIWEMDFAKLGETRAYIADFEVYGEKAQDPTNAIVDIYIGVKD